MKTTEVKDCSCCSYKKGGHHCCMCHTHSEMLELHAKGEKIFV